MKKTAFIFLALLSFKNAYNQTLKDTLLFSKVDIVGIKKTPDVFESRIDSITLAQYQTSNLATLLNENGGMYIKSFGAGSIGSASSQGTSSYHTTVFWNGIAISNPMLGQSDLAIIPVTVANNIGISNSPSVNGHVNIGSSILLSNVPVFDRSCTASFTSSIGSFGNYKFYLQTAASNTKHYFSVKPFYEKGENNFSYINRSRQGKPEMTQTNSELWQKGITADYAFQITPHQLLSAHVWLQKNYRENPPTMTTDVSTAYQDDILNRYLLSYAIEKRKTTYSLKAAWLDESVNYYDTIISLISPSRIKTLVNNLRIENKLLPNLQIESGINNSHFFAFTNEYKIKREQNRSSFFTHIKWNNKSSVLLTDLTLNEEFIEDKLNPLSFSVSGKLKLYDNLYSSVQFAKTNRLPTLNDLFWVPGGNKDLLPENGYCYNAGVNYKKEKKTLNYSLGISAFNKNITNWIQWLPGRSGYWEPQNVYKVWTRGAEIKAQVDYRYQKLKFQLTINTIYSRATRNEKQQDELNDKQLIYVPELLANGGLGISYSTTYLLFNAHYKSKRFTTSDNKNYLDDQAIFNTSLQQKIVIRKKEMILVRFSVNNLFDQDYENILYRPMPGRNYELTLQFNIQNNLK